MHKKESEKAKSSTPKKTSPDENDLLPDALTLAQIKSAGEEAARLLNSPAYNQAHRMAVELLMEEWVESEADQSVKREQLYLQIRSLGLTAQMLLQMVNQAVTDDSHRYEQEEDYGLGPLQ